MARTQKTTAMYPHPFSKAYWRDAASEVKSVKTLVIASLMVALRVATKGLALPIAPNLDLFNVASFINALSAMIIGPVMAIPAAILSDFLGVLFWDGLANYFLPYVLQEIGSSLIWGLLLYRAKVTPWRVIIGRFSICLIINILLGTAINKFYYQFYGLSATAATMLTWPRVFKNVFMFPIEAVVMTFFLSLMVPITSRMGLTYGNSDAKDVLKFGKKQIALLAVLFVLGVGSVFGYLAYHYNTTSLSASYSTEERISTNKQMLQHLAQQDAQLGSDSTVTVVESAYKKFLGSEITYTVAIYEVADGVEVTDDLWKLKKTPASKHESLTRVGTVTIVVEEDSGKVISMELQASK